MLDGEKAQVVIVSTPQAIESLTAAIERFGGESQAYYDGNLQALVPIDSIETLTKRWDVQRIREPRRPSTQTPMQAVGTVSEGLAALNASAWYSAGYDGTGVRVAVIDIGFTGYSALLGSGFPARLAHMIGLEPGWAATIMELPVLRLFTTLPQGLQWICIRFLRV